MAILQAPRQCIIYNGTFVRSFGPDTIARLSCLDNLLILMILITSVVRPFFGPFVYHFPMSYHIHFALYIHTFTQLARPAITQYILFGGALNFPDTDHCRRWLFVTMSFSIHSGIRTIAVCVDFCPSELYSLFGFIVT